MNTTAIFQFESVRSRTSTVTDLFDDRLETFLLCFLFAKMSTTQLVRFKRGKHSFEVMTNVGSAQKFRDGKLGLDNVLQADVVWTNQSKGERAKGSELKYIFHLRSFVFAY